MQIIVEQPPDPNNCTTISGSDLLETAGNTTEGIRIFLNDVYCSPQRTDISVCLRTCTPVLPQARPAK